ncbi:outer membrane protein assembly factor BamB family protein [Parapedobacter koreensis]|uniref:Quinoprotein glucose dehydrogenase n=1 Tax=Parapedobacter koreensis TaxID=332977 RepID=A0A1H7FZG4_9SPHI|nr:PQQ-binding-like beta-propeller repeat protein [Parapedobacter koreensis]SEK29902.1 quinoprotein glucose dehydrogenase [Parapedobacter koreensis]
MFRITVFSTFLFAMICCGCSNDNTRYKEWNDYGGGPDHSKYVDYQEFTKDNVDQLEVAFVYPTDDNVNYRFNPVIVDGVMYVLAKNNSLVAIDAVTGKELWIHANLRGIIQRGVNFWQSKDKKEKRLLICLNNTLQAIDANTGKSITTFGNGGYVDLKQGLDRDPATFGRATSTTPGKVFEDLILLGSAPGENLFSGPGHLRAYNVITGELVWVFHTIPHPGEYGYDTWPEEAYKYVGGTNTWGEISVDADRGIAYFPIGSPTYDYDGADRPGSNLFGNCILALDARTGKRLWHFQTVHHDIWDYDLTAAPQLITVNHDGKKIDAVAIASKHGFLFVFDRVSGEPLWPIEERPVPASDMPDEQAWPTQPFPTVVPPFNRQIVTVDDINPYFSQEDKTKWTARVAAAKNGLFQPLSASYEIVTNPGAVGGANFGNTAADPQKGIVYVQTQELADFYSLKKREPAPPRSAGGFGGGRNPVVSPERLAQGKVLYAQHCQTCHGENRAGINGLGTTLVNLSTRVNTEAFKGIMAVGKGRMPGFPHLTETEIADIYAYLTPEAQRGPGNQGGEADLPEGPVVASGGVPVDLPSLGGRMSDYPSEYTGPRVEYVETNNWGLGVPNLLTPPWSLIVAYDLNEGKIKWKIPLGNDDSIPGSSDLSMPNGSQGKGMVVTSTGLLFSTCLDGRVYAYDTDDGRILWSTDLGRNNPGGLPAMYEVDGKQYLVVCSVGSLKDKSKDEAGVPKGYIVYALPKKGN